ncbi:MAG: hypothetical protein L6Q59_02260 [Ignavibacteriaceae bacterium]|nr:hypothetical protein [Ignavibacteriaceae bacterium]
MLKLKSREFFTIVLTVLFLAPALSAQTAQQLQERRQREHKAVEDLLNFKLSKSPVNQNKTNTSSLKYGKGSLGKTTANSDRKSLLMNGNNITVQIENYGGIAPGFGGIREITNLIWRDAPYIFQFSPIVGASVIDADGKRVEIITDGMNDYDRPGLREIDPATGLKWQWQPLPGYADPNQPNIASNPAFDSDRDGKPDSWPRDWYNATLGQYVWPGYLVQGENNADLEAYWAMDDRDNKEFRYYPFNNDTTRRGLGVQIDGRAFQWSNSLAANSIFFVWSITNVSDKRLDSVIFGIYGDPDVGGNDNDDDNGLFISPFDTTVSLYARNMVYFWDPDMTGDFGKTLGYLGCKFLESPGSLDGIDNDGDGLIDERQNDGIDNDNDWNPATDDVGIDGIAGTGDFGEGDGLPTASIPQADGRPNPLTPGEPNFEYTDLDESDQIGLTSFKSSAWATDLRIGDDQIVWNQIKPGNFSEITQNEDIVFIFSSGYISLDPGETKRISMAFLFGEDLSDLLTTAETVQDIYNKNYRFFRPPSLPKVTAVPGDRKVTLYWDTNSENSVDPITGKDFEGYVIYRSTRPDFADIQTISDGRGSKYLYEPLKDLRGFDAKWDIKNEWKGFHPVPYQGRGVSYYLGDNSGLQHTFVDSNNVINGQTYYYAVVAYDHGDSLGIPPSETNKKISVDPITSELRFSDNTVQVIPGPRASGYQAPGIGTTDVLQVTGKGNGGVNFRIVDDLDVIDEKYTLTFKDTIKVNDTTKVAGKNYSVTGEKPKSEKVYFYGTKVSSLQGKNIINDQFLALKDAAGAVFTPGVDYIINYEKGTLQRIDGSPIQEAKEYTFTYRNYEVYQSTALKGEDSNPVFNGVLVTVNDYPTLAFDADKSKWSDSDIKIPFNAAIASIGTRKKLYAGDYIITFSDQNIGTAKKRVPPNIIDIPVKYKVEEVSTGVPIPIVTLLEEKAKNDTAWTRGDEIIFFAPGATGLGTDTLTWGVTTGTVSASDSTIPGDGDKLFIYTKRPYSKDDLFTLNTKAGSVNTAEAASRLDNIYVVPNPYVGANDLEPANRLSGQNRGERRIYFENLPQKCTIRIYTISGELVNTLEHESGFDNGREYWNLLNKDGFSIAYGVYLAHIDAPGIGQKLIKFAIIK